MQERLLKVSGFMILMIGTAHFFMPSLGYDADTIASIPALPRDHFVYLGTYAIGTFLISFAIMTLLVPISKPSRADIIFLGLMAAVWLIRMFLEMIYPVELSLFFIDNPHPVLLATIAFIFVSYALAFLKSLRRLKFFTSSVEER